MQIGHSDPSSDEPLRIELPENGFGPTTIEINVRYSTRARRASLRVRPGVRPEVVLPLGSAPGAAHRLLTDHEKWLRQKLAWAQSVEAQAHQFGLLSPGLVWIEGRAQAAPTVASNGGMNSADWVERWYRRQAKATLAAVTKRASDRLNEDGLVRRKPGRITIRDPRSRWGSCSSKGNLSYSWRLVMMPLEAMEYVVYHELCHLEVLDHSAHFWQLLEAARPSWRAEAAWLRRYGPLISLHRPSPSELGTTVPLPIDLPAVTLDGGIRRSANETSTRPSSDT